MADNLHKTMAMDDKFTSLTSKAQTAIDKLVELVADMNNEKHSITSGQKGMIRSLQADVAHLVASME